VKPLYVMLNGEDQDAFIADANLERRDLTKGQKAMLLAVRFPDSNKGGRGKKGNAVESTELSQERISRARVVNRLCPEMVDAVIEGKTGLDEAYAEANRRRATRRCGELLAQIKPAHGANQNIKGEIPPKVTRESAARDAGMSERQRKTALRVAAVPQADFPKWIGKFADPTCRRYRCARSRVRCRECDTVAGY
jgi:hypothetical protein